MLILILTLGANETHAQKTTLKDIETELGVRIPDQWRAYAESVIEKLDEEALQQATKMIAEDIKDIDDPTVQSEYVAEAMNMVDDAYTGEQSAVTA